MRLARPIVIATTMLAVAAMAFATSVPANALLHHHQMESADAAAYGAEAAASGSIAAQLLATFDAAPAAVARDGYTVTTPPPPPPPVRWPFDGAIRVSDDFGPRASPCSGCSSMHRGTDFLPGAGNPVYAVADGVVLKAVDSDVGLGVYVVLQHSLDGEIVTTTYAHMDFGSLQVSEGQTVSAGSVLGRVGNSGASTGPHLHFEVRPGGADPVDSEVWLAARAN